MSTVKEIMESLHEIFGQSSFSLRHDAIKYVHDCCMKEGVSVRELVLDMMVYFNVAEVNSAITDEKSQVGFILESLLKSFLQFCMNALMNKIKFNLTMFINELQAYHTMMRAKGLEPENFPQKTKHPDTGPKAYVYTKMDPKDISRILQKYIHINITYM
ncbi:uncharacterized protein LOC120077288 [Benincasa hispida]|uniref:uncharacterized protein LOC120077288 n=1 Tax=Benincasa hispida TaxID=102211 RepID=UPI0019010FAE|nr:uncharacterized protein LOC120077288 [Benincasa hispida]